MGVLIFTSLGSVVIVNGVLKNVSFVVCGSSLSGSFSSSVGTSVVLRSLLDVDFWGVTLGGHCPLGLSVGKMYSSTGPV